MKIKLATVPVLIMAVFVCPYPKVSAQGCSSSTSANATSLSTTTYSGAAFSWSNPGNAQTSDGSYATAGISLGAFATAHSDYLTIQNFGFSIPSTATICEIIVEVERSASGLGIGGGVTDQSVRLLQNGALYGNDLANTTAAWPASDGTATYGNALLSSTWGGSWQSSDVNNPNFGVAISTQLNTGVLGLFLRGKIDQVHVTVIYDPNTILALSLQNFTAARSPDGDGHRISWTAGVGTTGDRCVIQRSGNSRDWVDIATVAADVAMYTDHYPLAGANFYRLRVVDMDGKSVYSTVSEVMEDKTTVRCWPNPFRDIIYVSGPSPVKRVVLKDLQGRIFYTRAAATPTSDWQIPAAGLRPGIYFVQLGTGTFKMLKK